MAFKAAMNPNPPQIVHIYTTVQKEKPSVFESNV